MVEDVAVQGVVRRRLAVAGIVQGVGFRPFVWRRATRLGLAGFVSNGPDGVVIEVQGPGPAVDLFGEGFMAAAPPLAEVAAIETTSLPAQSDDEGFVILASREHGPGGTSLPADVATCAACRDELRDPSDRRHRHPFIN